MIALLEPTRPPHMVSAATRYHDEVTRRLIAAGGGRRLAIEPEALEATVRALLREPGTAVVVDGAFVARTGRPLPADVVALLHALPDLRPWCATPVHAVASSARIAESAHDRARSVALVRPGIDACFVPPPHAPGNERPRIVCVGTLCAAKGQHLVVEAVADEGVCELVFVGDLTAEPAYVAALREEAEDTPLTFTGSLPPEAVAAELQRADLFVATARDVSFPLAAAEAAACGVPVLAFDTGEIDAFVRDGENGWLLARDADDAVMQQWILDLVADRARVAQARRQAGPTLLRSWDEVTRELLAYVATAVGLPA